MDMPIRVGQGICIRLRYLNSKRKIIGGGRTPPPPSKLGKNSPIGNRIKQNNFQNIEKQTIERYLAHGSIIFRKNCNFDLLL